MKKGIILIGIDGGTFNVINPLFEKGKLPNLKKFKNRGVLKSTIPPGTAVSWASFYTGNLPGKTGIYDFTIVEDSSWKINFVNGKVVSGKPIWKYLDEKKLKSCFVNIPLTYPPSKINGVMISGIDAPSTMNSYVHPAELKEKLKEFNYEIEVSALENKEEISKKAINVLDKRIEVAKYLLEKEFDFFVVLFRESDVAQHFAWGKKEVEIIYSKIDRFIGEIEEKAKKYGKEIIVISDHGEEKVDKAFNINVWLESEGYLKTRHEKTNLFSVFGITRERIFRVLKKLNFGFLVRVVPRNIAKKMIPTKDIDFEEAILTNLIDFTKTKAIGKRAVKTSQIFLNKEGRGGIVKKNEEDKLKKEIKEKLEKFFKNNNLAAKIKTKEELYGKNTNFAPDITLYLQEKGYDTLSHFSDKKEIFDIPKEQATHNTEGIIFTDLNLKLKNAGIIDLCPTILKYFGVKGGRFDGKSLL